ncbi:MAG TPA: hypothetical protein VFV24_08805, partial [Candidatus Eisenbacteria bacterium]|nr:hypothetical protein [Candidatus Eisenbacteria bacterium]
ATIVLSVRRAVGPARSNESITAARRRRFSVEQRETLSASGAVHERPRKRVSGTAIRASACSRNFPSGT